jgi:hypothetical protein
VARCKIYEIQGPEASQTAGAVRCHRDAVARITVAERDVRVCKRHQGDNWRLFLEDGWVYAVDREAAVPKAKKKKRK